MAAAASTTHRKKVSASSYIHNNIAFSILSKLPLKSLTRFTCAQKSWSLLLQNHAFINMFRTNFFLSKHENNDDDDDKTRLIVKEMSLGFPIEQSLCILSGERFEDRMELYWPPPFQEDDNVTPFPLSIKILGSASVNATLCLYKGFSNVFKIVLWNPATAEFKMVPPSLQPYEKIEFNFIPLGFGYDRVRDDYKVIRKVQYPLEFKGDWIYLPNRGDPFWETDVHELDMNDGFWEEKGFIVKTYEPFWEIYSLKSNSWRKLDGVDMPVSYPGDRPLVNVNGFCHWLTKVYDMGMTSFDFSKETFIATTLPSHSDVIHEWFKTNLVTLNGSLSLIINYDRTPYFHIWILGELGVKESWTKFFIVGPSTCIMNPISVGKKSSIFFRKESSGQAWFLDVSTQKIEKIGGVREESICEQIVVYKKNLLPFGGMNN